MYISAVALVDQYVFGCAPSGLKGSVGKEQEGTHYKLIAQMAAAIGHNQGGSLWGTNRLCIVLQSCHLVV